MNTLDRALLRLEGMPAPGAVLYHGTSGRVTATFQRTAIRAIHFAEFQNPSYYNAFSKITVPRQDSTVLVPAGQIRETKWTTDGWNEVTFADPRAALDQVLRQESVGLDYVNGELYVSSLEYPDSLGIYTSGTNGVVAQASRGTVQIKQGQSGWSAYPGSQFQPQLRSFVGDLERLVPGLLYTFDYGTPGQPAQAFLATLSSSADIWDPNRPLVLYHGTSSRLYYAAELEQIRDKLGGAFRPIEQAGLLPPSLTGNINWSGSTGSPYGDQYDAQIYLTALQDSASKYADHAIRNFGGRRLVLQVTVPDKTRLAVDDDFYEHAQTGEQSLVYYGQVAYRGRIPPTYIQVAWEDSADFEQPGLIEVVPRFTQLAHETGRIKRFLEAYKDVIPTDSLDARGYLQALDLSYGDERQWGRVAQAVEAIQQQLDFVGYFGGKPVTREQIETAAQKVDEALTRADAASTGLEPFFRDAERITGQKPPADDPQSSKQDVRQGRAAVEWLDEQILRPLAGWGPDYDREEELLAKIEELGSQLEMSWYEDYRQLARAGDDLTGEWRSAMVAAEEAFPYRDFGYVNLERRQMLVRKVAARRDFQQVSAAFQSAMSSSSQPSLSGSHSS